MSAMKAENEVLYHAISFFLKETERCYLTKLLKLVYLFDLEHIRSVGVSATGKRYHAWGLGPVTRELYYSVHGDMDNGFDDFKSNFEVAREEYTEGRFRYLLSPLFNFDEEVFSPFQMELMKRLASRYKTDVANVLVDATHQKNDPWHIVYEIRGEGGREIPMDLAFENLDENRKGMLKARFAST